MIVYLAALTAIDPALHEAARVDGASKWQRIRHIDIPGIMPVITILFILAIGNLFNLGFEKVLLMQTDLNLPTSEVIQTYVYNIGLQQAQFSYSAAIGLFNSLINLVLLLTFNWVAKRAGQSTLRRRRHDRHARRTAGIRPPVRPGPAPTHHADRPRADACATAFPIRCSTSSPSGC